MTETAYVVGDEQEGRRVDLVAAELSGLTRSRIQRLIELKTLTVNSRPVKPNLRVRAGDAIRFTAETEAEPGLVPEDIPLRILFRDSALVVVDKPAGMVVYPAAGHSRGTLMNSLAFHCGCLASVGSPLRPGVVHRLDRDTSGVMVVALDDAAYYPLVEQFRQRTISRLYRTIVYGSLSAESGEISLGIGRSGTDRKKMSTRTRRSKNAVTAWKRIERFQNADLLEARLRTGRTHQIRVHFSAIGHPVLGDRTYGKKLILEKSGRRLPVPRQMLHAETLGFRHPVTGEDLAFTSPVPPDMEEVIDLLRSGFRPA